MKKLTVYILSIISISCKPCVVIVQCPHNKVEFESGATTIWGYTHTPMLGPITLVPADYKSINITFDSVKTFNVTK